MWVAVAVGFCVSDEVNKQKELIIINNNDSA